MAPIRHPLVDLVMNDETSVYIGHLERKILRYAQEDQKMRALLELLTGNMWDDTDFRALGDAEIQTLAVNTLKRRLNISEADAQNLVAERWNQAVAGPQDPETLKKTASYMFGPGRTKAEVPHNVTIARPIGGKTTPPHYNVEKHLQGLEQAAKHRDAMRGQV